VISHGARHLIVDSTGLKLFGQGEWNEEMRILTSAAHLYRSEAAHRSDLMAPTIPISSRPPF
jgi:hypothetical protein